MHRTPIGKAGTQYATTATIKVRLNYIITGSRQTLPLRKPFVDPHSARTVKFRIADCIEGFHSFECDDPQAPAGSGARIVIQGLAYNAN